MDKSDSLGTYSKSKCSLKVVVGGGVAGELLWLGFTAPRELCFGIVKRNVVKKPDFRLNGRLLELHAE